MRGTVAKKIRQLYRRQYRAQLEGEVLYLNKILKSKPGRMPTWLWRWLGRIFFKEPLRVGSVIMVMEVRA